MRAKNRADLGIRYCATGLRLAASNVMAPLAVAVAVRLLPYRHADGGSRLFSLNRRRGRIIKIAVRGSWRPGRQYFIDLMVERTAAGEAASSPQPPEAGVRKGQALRRFVRRGELEPTYNVVSTGEGGP